MVQPKGWRDEKSNWARDKGVQVNNQGLERWYKSGWRASTLKRSFAIGNSARLCWLGEKIWKSQQKNKQPNKEQQNPMLSKRGERSILLGLRNYTWAEWKRELAPSSSSSTHLTPSRVGVAWIVFITESTWRCHLCGVCLHYASTNDTITADIPISASSSATTSTWTTTASSTVQATALYHPTIYRSGIRICRHGNGVASAAKGYLDEKGRKSEIWRYMFKG